ncbi:unnamed protein product [Vicia faba]|uniref:Uncharacterized protein n=1 Tax=Vicia faba TaxID=3906 RepID=A0AAV1A778_VICFA|nr:unnamed protein product [Vicia faba]
MNISTIMKDKACSQEVIKLANIEEYLLRQKAKIDWIRLGDISSAYFYSNLKDRYKQAQINNLVDKDGKNLVDHDQIEKEVINFYQGLVGSAATSMKKIDIEVLRNGNQVKVDQCHQLMAPAFEKEVHQTG